MKTKIFPILIVLLLVFTSCSIIGISSDEGSKLQTCVKDETFNISQATIESNEEYISVDVAEADSFIMDVGKPMLPIITKTFTFPFGTKITGVSCVTSGVSEKTLSAKIQPAPSPYPIVSIKHDDIIKNNVVQKDEVYERSEVFPNTCFDYKATAGLRGEDRVITVTVNYYPLRYNPADDVLIQSSGFDLKVYYEVGENPIKVNEEDSYDMVIIAPRAFKSSLSSLVDHKNSVGVKTLLKTTGSIYADALLGKYGAVGRDKAETIKYFIKYAIEEYNIKYVLLVGGRVGQLFRWYVPVRYSNLDDGTHWERSFVSDLYFADVYDSLGHFDDWDSNSNGIFAEWIFRNDGTESDPDFVLYKDELDLDPDIYVGRLACRNKAEVETVVSKIINYETSAYDSDWFNNMTLFGGDTIPPDQGGPIGSYEGEIETGHGASFMSPLGFNIKKMWASNNNLTGSQDTIDAINEGAGFLFFSGHGNPLVWSTHPPDSTHEDWIDGLCNFEMGDLNNGEKLPVCVVGGCHNSQFDVTVLNIVKGILEEGFKDYFSNSTSYNQRFYKAEWATNCWSWGLVKAENGGSIATIGNTGLGYGICGESGDLDGDNITEPDCVETLDGWITTRFFENYALLSQQGDYSLGQIHSQTVSDYLHTFPPADNWDGRHDQKTIQEWALLGDPSLRIGGYPPN